MALTEQDREALFCEALRRLISETDSGLGGSTRLRLLEVLIADRVQRAVTSALTEAAERIESEGRRLAQAGERGAVRMKDAAAIVRGLIPTAAPPP